MTKNYDMINENAARQDADDVEQVAAVPGVVPRVPQPIFAIVNAPLINDISPNEDVKAVLRTVRDSFNEDLLETRWDIDIEDLTDEFLMEKIKELTSSFMNKE
ncbi:hypothetical protein DVH05_014692 [Phytophthora capsici]|nr:hypothetical protein DVH05_014692 [Phytophthora capsici]